MSGEGAGSHSPSAPLLSSIVGYLLRRAQQFHTANWTTVLAGEVTGPQYAVLDVLARRPDADRRTIASIAGLDATSTAEVIARLTARGWLAGRPDPDDRRRQVQLTRDGQRVMDRIQPQVARVQERLMTPVRPVSRAPVIAARTRIAFRGEVPADPW